MNKNIIFSHESDIDGLGCIVLGKLAFQDIDYETPNKLLANLRMQSQEYLLSALK